MIPPTKHPRADYADDLWERAHIIPDFDSGPGWREWLAFALVVAALVGMGFIAGWISHANAMAQAETCIEGCL